MCCDSSHTGTPSPGPDVEIKGSHYPGLKGVSVLGLKNATESRTPSKPAGHFCAGAAADTVTAQYWPASPAWTVKTSTTFCDACSLVKT